MIEITSTAIENGAYLSIGKVALTSQTSEKGFVNPVDGGNFSQSSENQFFDQVDISPIGRELVEEFTTRKNYGNLSEPDKRKVAELKRMDRKVRSHEQAHVAIGGNLVCGGAVYGYHTGPDGKRYAVASEVTMDASPVKDNPEAALQKARRLKQAALAPAQPSSQDRAVATAADQMIAEAIADIHEKTLEKLGLLRESSDIDKTGKNQKKDDAPFWESEDWYFPAPNARKATGYRASKYINILI